MRMVAQPASVPVARRFVDDALTDWGRESLIDDVGLCVTELSTNATLHSGSSYFEVELQRIENLVRVAVRDSGQAPADSLASKSEFADFLMDELTIEDTSTTGRGMFIVSALATAWGIEELEEGKRVWAEFSTADVSYDAGPPEVTHSADRLPVPPVDPADWVAIRFEECPAALLLAHDDNLSEVIRELQLIGGDLQHPDFTKLADLMSGHVQRHAVNWDAARLQALAAVRAGREFTDIHVLAPRDVMSDVRFLRSMIAEAEALSHSGALITLPAAPEVQRLRDWLESEFGRQAQGLGPTPFPTWLAGSEQGHAPQDRSTS